MDKKEQKQILGELFRQIRYNIQQEKDQSRKTFLVGVLTGIDLLDDKLCINNNADGSTNKMDLRKWQNEFGSKIMLHN